MRWIPCRGLNIFDVVAYVRERVPLYVVLCVCTVYARERRVVVHIDTVSTRWFDRYGVLRYNVFRCRKR